MVRNGVSSRVPLKGSFKSYYKGGAVVISIGLWVLLLSLQ